MLGYRFSHKAVLLESPVNIFAHRGVRNYYAENSLEGFLAAKRLGFKALEVDISLTKDKYPVIFHDDNCKRLLGIDTLIENVNYNFLKGKKIIFNNQKTNNEVLLLSNFIKNYQKDMLVYLDIKIPSKSLADSLLYYLSKYKKLKNTIVADDNIFFLGYLKYKNPQIITVLEGYNKGKEYLYYIIPHKYRPDYYSSFLSETNEKHIKFLKNNNLLSRKIVYGVEKFNLDKAIKSGFKNIILDFDSSMINCKNIKERIENEKIR